MTLNFAANFLGLDSAATPFGLKAMESLQEINPDKDKASDAQIMFMCLHASGLTLIATSIIGYRAAAGSANPADVMLPCIITSFIGTIAARRRKRRSGQQWRRRGSGRPVDASAPLYRGRAVVLCRYDAIRQIRNPVQRPRNLPRL